jgi:replicative DNA helicase
MLDYGKLPPHDVELEKVVLGALILERDAIYKVDIPSDVFYKNEHQKIYEAILSLNKRGSNIDLMEVTTELRNAQILDETGGASYITSLTKRVASAANIEQHVRHLLVYWIRRKLISAASNIITQSYDTTSDIEETIKEYESAVSEIDNVIAGKNKGRSLGEVLSSLTRKIEERCIKAKESGITGIPTGFKTLDFITSGWQSDWLIILAARPAMGKTAIGVNAFAKAAALSGNWVNVFSLEMGAESLAERIVLGASGIEPERLKHGKMNDTDWGLYNQTVRELEDMSIWIDDTSYASLYHMRNVARQNVRKGKCDLIIIDYLQLADAGSDRNSNREEKIAELSRSLKALSKELQVPIIVLSQLNRGVESRPDKKPRLSDIRESGAIEQDADMVLLPYRPNYYGIEVEGTDDPEHYGEIIMGKFRHGSIMDIPFYHNDTMTEFSERSFYANVDYSEGMEPKPF